MVAQATIADFGGGGFAEALLLGTLLVVLVVAAFAHSDRVPAASGGLRAMDVRTMAIVAGATMLVGSAAAYVTNGAYAPRYASVIVPFFLVVAAVGITRLRPSWVQTALVAGDRVPGARRHRQEHRRPAHATPTTSPLPSPPRPPTTTSWSCAPTSSAPASPACSTRIDSRLAVVPYPAGGDAHVVDWRDYAKRNAKADPTAFAKKILARADGAPIWVVWNGTYRTFTGQCETLVTTIGAARG